MPIDLSVDYKRVNAFFADYAKNIRKGGTFIRTDKPLPVGTEFFFRLRVPHLGDPIVLKGRVQWIVTPEVAVDAQPAGMGIGFVYESEADRRGMQATVETLMKAELGEHVTERLIADTRES